MSKIKIGCTCNKIYITIDLRNIQPFICKVDPQMCSNKFKIIYYLHHTSQCLRVYDLCFIQRLFINSFSPFPTVKADSKHSFVIKIEQFLKNISYCYVSLKIRMRLINPALRLISYYAKFCKLFPTLKNFRFYSLTRIRCI